MDWTQRSVCILRDRVNMIRDSNEDVRYVIQLPGTFDFLPTLEECGNTDLGDFKEQYTCDQYTVEIILPVLSFSKSYIELVAVKDGLPSRCSLRPVPLSEID